MLKKLFFLIAIIIIIILYPFILKKNSKYYVSFLKKIVYKMTDSHWLVNLYLGGEPNNPLYIICEKLQLIFVTTCYHYDDF